MSNENEEPIIPSDPLGARVQMAVGQLALLKSYGAGQHATLVDEVSKLLVELLQASTQPLPVVREGGPLEVRLRVRVVVEVDDRLAAEDGLPF